ncbi:MAG: phosphopantetheine-binding protein [Salibacteraceae bacterium]
MKEIFDNVCLVIENSIGTPKESIKMEDTFFDKLGVDSIDLVDILYELEILYDVELKVSDIELRVKEELGDTPYEIDGVITPEGLVAVRKHMTEIDPSVIKEGLTVHRLIQLFSVHSLCKIIQYRIEHETK